MLATYYRRRTFFVRQQRGRLEILEEVWEWVNGKLMIQEINIQLLLATGRLNGKTVILQQRQ